MLRFLVILVSSLIAVGGLEKPGLAQGAEKAPPLATLRAQNPLIDSVARDDPDGLRSLLSKLQFLAANHGAPARTGAHATAAENAQIAANPAFARAFKNDPDETLILLRATNDELQKARQAAALGLPQRLALVIGDSGDEAWGPLRNATNDAELIARTLKELGFDLVGGGPVTNPDRRQFEQAIRSFGRSIGPETVALFYFAGHGIQLDGHNYLVPSGASVPATRQDYYRDLVEVDGTVLRQMQQAGGRLNMMVLDACRDHPTLRGQNLASRGAGSPQGLAVTTVPPGMRGTVIIYSTAPGEIARDRVSDTDPNSPFAAAFAGAIIKPGVEVRDAFDEIQTRVLETTKGAQQPWISYSASGKFAFSGRLERQEATARIPMPGQSPFTPSPPAPVLPSPVTPYTLNIPPPAPHVVDRYVELKPGTSTLEDAKKLFGEPNSETPLSDGKVGIQWTWNNYDFIVIIFDNRGRMLRIYNRYRSNI